MPAVLGPSGSVAQRLPGDRAAGARRAADAIAAHTTAVDARLSTDIHALESDPATHLQGRGSLRGDIRDHAGDSLYLAGLTIAHGDPGVRARTRGILERARRHQDAHLAMLARHVTFPDTWEASTYWGSRGLDGPEARASRGRVLADEQDRRSEIDSLLTDPDRFAHWAEERRAAAYAQPAPEVDALFRDLLLAGDAAGAQAAWRAWLQTPAGAGLEPLARDPAEWERRIRLTRAQDVLGRVTGERVRGLVCMRLACGEEDLAAARDPRRHLRPVALPGLHRGRLIPRRSLGEVKRLAWALLRDTRLAEQLAAMDGAPRYANPGRPRVCIEADAATFGAWVAHVRALGPDTPCRVWADETGRVCARISTVLAGEATDLVVMVDLGEVDTTDVPRCLREDSEWMRTRFAELGVDAAQCAPWQVVSTQRLPAGLSYSTFDEEIGPACARETLLGPDVCDHEGAEWIAVGGMPARLARLACPQCIRPWAAAVPLHRVPEGHPVLAEAVAAAETEVARTGRMRGIPFSTHYGHHQAHDEILSGDPGPPMTLEAYRARDGVVSMDPADYAHHPRPPREAVPAPERPAEQILIARRPPR